MIRKEILPTSERANERTSERANERTSERANERTSERRAKERTNLAFMTSQSTTKYVQSTAINWMQQHKYDRGAQFLTQDILTHLFTIRLLALDFYRLIAPWCNVPSQLSPLLSLLLITESISILREMPLK